MTPYDPDGFFVIEDIDDEPNEEQPVALNEIAANARKSRVDEFIDVITGVKPRTTTVTCLGCGGHAFNYLSPVEGGTRVRRCRSCRREEPVGAVTTSAVINLPTGQMSLGPFYGPQQRMPERHSPTFRMRSTPGDTDDGRK